MVLVSLVPQLKLEPEIRGKSQRFCRIIMFWCVCVPRPGVTYLVGATVVGPESRGKPSDLHDKFFFRATP